MQWATAHQQKWPDKFTGDSRNWDQVGKTRKDWYDVAGGMDIPTDIRAEDSTGEKINSNTTNLWALVAQAGLSVDIFICPSNSGHQRDGTVIEFNRVRDFRAEIFCSYSYQNVLGPYTLSTSSAAQATELAVMADANPMRRDFWSGSPAGGVADGVTDRALRERRRFEEVDANTQQWNEDNPDGIPESSPWELNSPNHKFVGQNVLYLDGHVDFKQHPYCGARYDNIWTMQQAGISTQLDYRRLDTIRAYTDTGSYDGRKVLPASSNADSFIVP